MAVVKTTIRTTNHPADKLLLKAWHENQIVDSLREYKNLAFRCAFLMGNIRPELELLVVFYGTDFAFL